MTATTVSDNFARTTQPAPSGAFGGGICTTDQSPVTIAGSKCGVSADQRGVHRPRGPKCDIGSYERKP